MIRYLVLFIIYLIPLYSLELNDFNSSNEDLLTKYKQQLYKKKFISLNDDLDKDYIQKNVYLNDLLDTKGKKLFNDTMYLQVFMLGTVGFLYMLPPSITKWEEDPDDTRTIWEQYRDNIKDGPVWDEDDWAINYIGHPVSGAWYYMIARDDGFGPWESFLYSVAMSSFFWEYGYEAFAEIPSIQDLIFTPTIGAIMGEGFYYLEKELDKKRGIIWGSKTLGNVAYFFLNPIGNITGGMNDYFDISMDFRYQTFQPMAVSHVSPQLRKIDYVPSNYGFILDIKF